MGNCLVISCSAIGNCLPLSCFGIQLPPRLDVQALLPAIHAAAIAPSRRQLDVEDLPNVEVDHSSLLSDSILQRPSEDFEKLFELGNVLGKGQFGTTYLCVHRTSRLEFACKCYEKSKLSPLHVEDVRNEIGIMHHLSGHPNIVSIHDTFEDSSLVYIVMELCTGGELFRRVKDREYLSEREAAQLMRVILQEDSPLKAVDFGYSVLFHPGEILQQIAGSPHYVAPEVLLKSYDKRADIWSAGVILYVLLSGYMPFTSEEDDVLHGVLDLVSDPWPQISNSAKDLIRNMLNRDPEERFTAHQVLSHPWICEDGVAPDRPLDPAVLTRMKHFMTINKMKKIAMHFLARRLNEEETAGFEEIFNRIDADGNGAITFDAMKQQLEEMGSVVPDNEIQKIMEAVDISRRGSISKRNFMAATLHLSKLYKEKNLEAAFAYFDKDGSGLITMDELKQTCLENEMEEAEIQKLVEEIEKTTGGQIDYAQFVSMMRNGSLSR
ncbi:hypothetical protein GOP47_0028470 [Adiantum capillus-veneris]|nr:hypothetical protein GOP47_0028470 [Adiantum capillus-veneris]